MTQQKSNGKRVWRYRCRSKTHHPGSLWSAWKTGNWKILLFAAWHLIVIQGGKEGIREEDKFSLPQSSFVSFLLKAGQDCKWKNHDESGKELKPPAKPFLLCSLCLPPYFFSQSSAEKHVPVQIFSTKSLVWKKERCIILSYWICTELNLSIA